jgi:hypothetical protein
MAIWNAVKRGPSNQSRITRVAWLRWQGRILPPVSIFLTVVHTPDGPTLD